jgi:DNA-binding transcriptional ArsR family regulator
VSGQLLLRPADVGVALSLVEYPGASFEQLHEVLGISQSNAHAAVRRLRQAGLVRQDERVVVRSNLLDFLVHGVRYAFPGSLGASAKGVPTSHAGPVLSHDVVADDAIVWPSAEGSVVGRSLPPLVPKAAELPVRSPIVYALMTLVDALRVGRIRERRLATAHLRERVYGNHA